MQIAIIGAGFTGLACATTLAKYGANPTLFEKSSIIGGLAAGFKESNWKSSLEYYYHHWFKSDEYLLEFSRTWGIETKVKFSRPLTAIQTSSHGLVQLDSAISLLQYPELQLADKLRMGAALAYLRSLKDWRSLEQYTAEEWCRRFMGSRGYEALWLPLLKGKFGRYASSVNMAWFWARLATRTSELGTYEGGFGAMMHDVEKWLADNEIVLHKNAPVHATPTDRGWQITSGDLSQEFDQLVVAAGPSTFQTLCGQYAPQYTSTLQGATALGAQVVILSLDQKVGPYYWYSLRKDRDQPFLALIEHTNFVPLDEFGGEHLVYLADYVDTSTPEWARSDEELVQLAAATCKSINPGISPGSVRRSWVFRAEYAQPVVGPNASKRLPPLRVAEVANLYHASMGHVYPWDRGTNFALQLGDTVAKDILGRS